MTARKVRKITDSPIQAIQPVPAVEPQVEPSAAPVESQLATELAVVDTAASPATVGRRFFPRIRAAREMLMARAEEIVQKYMANADAATRRGQYDVARESYEFLIKHMPADEEGLTVAVQDIDKPKEVSKLSAPSIQIGFQLGGIPASKQFEAATVIDVTPTEDA